MFARCGEKILGVMAAHAACRTKIMDIACSICRSMSFRASKVLAQFPKSKNVRIRGSSPPSLTAPDPGVRLKKYEIPQV